MHGNGKRHRLAAGGAPIVDTLSSNIGPLNSQTRNPAQAYALHYGNAQAALVQVVPDSLWPGMFRMVWPDGQISDMANLSRARDAAAAICERGPPRRDPRRFHWKLDRCKTPAKAPPIRFPDWGLQ